MQLRPLLLFRAPAAAVLQQSHVAAQGLLLAGASNLTAASFARAGPATAAMADRAFDRMFNAAQAREAAAEEAYFAALPKKRSSADDEEDLRKAAAPMTAADAIARILLAWKDKDYFR